MVQFAFTGRTVAEALSKLQVHLKESELDGYLVTDLVAHHVTVYWRVVVYCLEPGERPGDKATLSSGQHGPVDHPPEALL
jgi:hypothetical protein